MKTNKLIVIILVMMTKITFAQVTELDNAWNGTGTPFLGWDNTSNGIHLKIEHQGSQNINFLTGGTQRMTILGTAATNPGYVGIGLASPQNLLHLYNSATTSNVYSQYATGSTSNTSADGFLVGVTWSAGHSTNDAELIQQENGPMNFYTFGVQRMAIKGGTVGGGTTGYVGIGNAFDAPVSRVHIKEGSDDTWLQLTNTGTGHSSGNGLRIGVINSSKNVEIRQQHDADMLLFTNSVERIRIKNNGNVGINTSTPTSSLSANFITEINSNSTDKSGLKLTQLLSTSATSSSNGKCLSVESHGEVILNDVANFAQSGATIVTSANANYVELGNSSTGNPLLHNTNITMYSSSTPRLLNLVGSSTAKEVVFGDYGATTGGVNIGETSTITDNSATNNTAGSFISAGTSAVNTAGKFIASGGQTYSCTACPASSLSFTSPQNCGVDAQTIDGRTGSNIGGSFIACGSTSYNIGIYSSVGTGCGTNWAAYLNGPSFTPGNAWTASDAVLKQNVTPIPNASQVLQSLNPVSYNFDTVTYASQINLPSGTHYGVLAQDLAAVLPELTKDMVLPATVDNAGNVIAPALPIKAVDYTSLIPFLIQGMKDQQAQIAALTDQINGCCSPVNRTTGSAAQEINLSSGEAILYQNQPNPFNNSTVIRYFVPANSGEATILFQDESGKTIKEINLTEQGQGTLQINAADLNSGIYTYSLSFNGKVIDSKKMMRAK